MEFYEVRYGEKESNFLDVYSNCNSNKTIVYVHGGGLEGGDKKTDSKLFREELYKKGYSVISVNYTMYPTAKFPEYIEDVAKALDFIKNDYDKFGYGGEIYVLGASAGAYISLMLFFDDKYLKKYRLSNNDFNGFIINSAQPTVHFRVLKERGLDTRAIRIDDAAPVYFVKEGKNTKLLLISYEDDMFCRLEQNEMFSKVLKGYNVKHEFKVLKGKHCSAEDVDENGKIRMLDIIDEFTKKR